MQGFKSVFASRFALKKKKKKFFIKQPLDVSLSLLCFCLGGDSARFLRGSWLRLRGAFDWSTAMVHAWSEQEKSACAMKCSSVGGKHFHPKSTSHVTPRNNPGLFSPFLLYTLLFEFLGCDCMLYLDLTFCSFMLRTWRVWSSVISGDFWLHDMLCLIVSHQWRFLKCVKSSVSFFLSLQVEWEGGGLTDWL